MGEITKIEWTHHSWSPWWGCTPASPGCDHCYARSIDRRAGGDHWGRGKPRRVVTDAAWANPRRWDREAMRLRFWILISETPHLDWLLLTKRPELAGSVLPVAWQQDPPENVWIGASVEDQPRADRIDALVRIPAAVRFLSIEPMLGPIDLGLLGTIAGSTPYALVANRISWVIVGAESGPGARPMSLDWVRSIRDQCVEAGVAFMFKQKVEGGRRVSLPELDGLAWDQVPEATR